jgi:hypothetical protein
VLRRRRPAPGKPGAATFAHHGRELPGERVPGRPAEPFARIAQAQFERAEEPPIVRLSPEDGQQDSQQAAWNRDDARPSRARAACPTAWCTSAMR